MPANGPMPLCPQQRDAPDMWLTPLARQRDYLMTSSTAKLPFSNTQKSDGGNAFDITAWQRKIVWVACAAMSLAVLIARMGVCRSQTSKCPQQRNQNRQRHSRAG
ncbi:MAG: hypothetical protein AAFY07_10565, partial [Pseudomonadota bacterium]